MLNINIHPQPDDETCGPTCLHAIYNYYQNPIELNEVIQTVERVKTGGTLAALLGKHAQKQGYDSKIYVYDLTVFDPTWFQKKKFTNEELIEKLKQHAKFKNKRRVIEASEAYIDYLQAGGKILYRELTVQLLKQFFKKEIPILTGLSATYLYQSMREYADRTGKTIHDDIKGHSCGHFVVLCGYDEWHRHIVVADPHQTNPISYNNYYKVSAPRLINAIMLGVLSYDANLLIIEKPEPTA